MYFETFRHTIGKGLDREHGHTMIEYAMVVGLVVMGAMVTISLMGQGVLSTTNVVSTALDGHVSSNNSQAPISDANPLIGTVRNQRLVAFVACGLVFFAVAFVWQRRNRISEKALPAVERDPDQFAEIRQRIQNVFKAHRHEMSTWAVRAEHVMERKFPSVTAKSKRPEIVECLEKSSLGVVLVLMSSGELAGVIGPRELAASNANDALGMMTSPLDCVDANGHLSSVIELMHRKGHDWVPVVSHGAICGVVTIGSVMATLLCTLHLITEIDQEYQVILRRSLGMSATNSE